MNPSILRWTVVRDLQLLGLPAGGENDPDLSCAFRWIEIYTAKDFEGWISLPESVPGMGAPS